MLSLQQFAELKETTKEPRKADYEGIIKQQPTQLQKPVNF